MKSTTILRAVSVAILTFIPNLTIVAHGASIRHLKGFHDIRVVDETNQDVPVEGENRIYNGKSANMTKDVPYMVGLRASIDGLNYCGGVLISEARVLTAASCRNMRSNDMLGKLSRPLSDTSPEPSDNDPIYVSIGSAENKGRDSGEQIKVHEIIPPPIDFDGEEYDIMILVLARRVSEAYRHFANFDKKYRTVNRFALLLRPKATAYGWGQVDPYESMATWIRIGMTPSKELKKAELSLITREKCQKSYGFQITSTMVCAEARTKPVRIKLLKSNPGSSLCVGDTGAPLIYKEKVVGIMAKADSTQCGHKPVVFTRVGSIYYWIQDNLGSDGVA